MPPQEQITSPFGQGPSSLSQPAPNPTPEPQGVSVSLPGMNVLEPEAKAEEIPPGVSDFAASYANPKPTPNPDSSLPLIPGRGSGNEEIAPISIMQVFERAQTDEDKAGVLSNWVGQDNVLHDGNNWYFRKPGQSGFSTLEKSWSDLGSDLKSGKFQRAWEDTKNMLGQYPNVLQGAAAGSASAAGAAALGAAGVASLPLAVGGAAAGVLGAGIYGLIREDSYNDLVKNKEDPSKQVTPDMMYQAIGEGTVNLGILGFKTVTRKLKDIAQKMTGIGTELERAKLTSDMVGHLEELGARISGRKNIDLIGEELKTGFDHIIDNAGEKYIGKWTKIIGDAAEKGNQRVPVDKILGSMREQLTANAGVKFSEDGTILSVPRGARSGLQLVSKPETPFDQIMGSLDENQVKAIQDRMMADGFEPKSTLGSKVEKMFSGGEGRLVVFDGESSAMPTLNRMLDDYNKLLAQKINYNGVTYDNFLAMKDAYKVRGNYDVSKAKEMFSSEKETSAARRIHGSFIETNRDFGNAMLKDTPNMGSWSSDNINYRLIMDSAKDLKQVFSSDNNPGYEIVKRALNTDNPRIIQDLKIVFQDHPEVQKRLKGAFFMNLIDENTKGDSGYVNMKGISESFNKYHTRVISELFTPVERRQLQGFMNNFSKVMTADLSPIESEQSKETLATMAKVLLSVKAGAFYTAEKMFKMTSTREEALMYLKDQFLARQAKIYNTVGDIGSAGEVQQVMDILSNFVELSDSVKIGNKTMLVPSQSLKILWAKMGVPVTGLKMGTSEMAKRVGKVAFKPTASPSPSPEAQQK